MYANYCGVRDIARSCNEMTSIFIDNSLMLESDLHLLIPSGRDVILTPDFMCITSFLMSISSETAKFRPQSLPCILSSHSKMCQDIGYAFHKPMVNTLRTGLLSCLNARSRVLTFRHRASCI